jgi:hypothetical protein
MYCKIYYNLSMDEKYLRCAGLCCTRIGCMPKKKPGSRSLNKQSQNFRLPPDMIRRLGVAAERLGVSKTVYVQWAIMDRLKVDGIK